MGFEDEVEQSLVREHQKYGMIIREADIQPE